MQGHFRTENTTPLLLPTSGLQLSPSMSSTSPSLASSLLVGPTLRVADAALATSRHVRQCWRRRPTWLDGGTYPQCGVFQAFFQSWLCHAWKQFSPKIGPHSRLPLRLLLPVGKTIRFSSVLVCKRSRSNMKPMQEEGAVSARLHISAIRASLAHVMGVWLVLFLFGRLSTGTTMQQTHSERRSERNVLSM